LHEKGFLTLSQVVDQDHSSLWSQEWKLMEVIRLIGEDEREWEGYIISLKFSHVRIKDSKDDQKTQHVVYTLQI